MPRFRVIVLDKVDDQTWRFAMWADVPVARQPFYVNPSATSAWKDATTQDTTALQNGAVVERVVTTKVQQGWTLAQVEAEVQRLWAEFQAFVSGSNPWIRYGSTWDGTTWTLGGVA